MISDTFETHVQPNVGGWTVSITLYGIELYTKRYSGPLHKTGGFDFVISPEAAALDAQQAFAVRLRSAVR